MIGRWLKRAVHKAHLLDPRLCNVFQNDLPLQVGEASISMYADDHQVYVAGHTSEGVVKNLVRDGERLTQWYKDNLLTSEL